MGLLRIELFFDDEAGTCNSSARFYQSNRGKGG